MNKIKNITWSNKPMSKKANEKSIKEALNEPLDKGLIELCKRLEKN